MGATVKQASLHYGAGEIVFFRGLVGLAMMALLMRVRGLPLATSVPAMHLWRSMAGVVSLCLWFHAIGGLPLGTAVTLNYMSSVWIAVFLMAGTLLPDGPAARARGVDGRVVLAVLTGFAGVALVLRPTIEQEQLWHGLCGLLSGLLAAIAYLQVAALGRAGELFVAELEARRLHAAGQPRLAERVQHVAATRGDGLGYDVLSFDEGGRERLIEVKTTAFGELTPFYVTRNEVARSEADAGQYHLYRLFDFRDRPRLFDLPGSISSRCDLEAVTFLARIA